MLGSLNEVTVCKNSKKSFEQILRKLFLDIHIEMPKQYQRLILVLSTNSQGFKRCSIYVEQTAQLYQNTYCKDLKTYIKDVFSSATDPFIFVSVA